MKKNTKLTAATPSGLMLNPWYWLTNEPFFLVLLSVSILVFVSLFDLNFPRLDDPLILVSIIIYVFGIWGIVIVAKSLVNLKIEQSIAAEISVNLGVELSKIRHKEKNKILLNRVLELLPVTSPKFNSAMIRLVNYIVQEAQDRKFYSSDVITRAYREEAFKELFKINSTQKIALRLGILGTFVGLIIAFVNLGEIDQIDENFQTITGALQYSFSTSIAGLVVSVILALFTLLLNKRRENYFKIMEDTAQVSIALVRNSINKDAFIASFDQMKLSLEEVRDSVYDQQARTQAQTNAIQNGILKLKDSKSEFDEFLTKISSDMARAYEVLSPEKLGLSLKESMSKSVEGISEVLNTNIGSHLKQYDELSNTMSLLGENLSKIEAQLMGQINLNKEALVDPKQNAYTAIADLSTMQKDYLEQITKIQANWQTDRLFEGVTNTLSENINRKSESIIAIATRMEESFSNYSEIIEARVPVYSKKKVVIFTTVITLFISGLVLYLTVPETFGGLRSFLESIINF